MEDDQKNLKNGRRPKKIKKMEDDQNKMEDDQKKLKN